MLALHIAMAFSFIFMSIWYENEKYDSIKAELDNYGAELSNETNTKVCLSPYLEHIIQVLLFALFIMAAYPAILYAIHRSESERRIIYYVVTFLSIPGCVLIGLGGNLILCSCAGEVIPPIGLLARTSLLLLCTFFISGAFIVFVLILVACLAYFLFALLKYCHRHCTYCLHEQGDAIIIGESTIYLGTSY